MTDNVKEQNVLKTGTYLLAENDAREAPRVTVDPHKKEEEKNVHVTSAHPESTLVL